MNAARTLIHREPVSIISRLAAMFGPRSRRRELDSRHLSDYLMRDIGFLDGKGAVRRGP